MVLGYAILGILGMAVGCAFDGMDGFIHGIFDSIFLEHYCSGKKKRK